MEILGTTQRALVEQWWTKLDPELTSKPFEVPWRREISKYINEEWCVHWWRVTVGSECSGLVGRKQEVKVEILRLQGRVTHPQQGGTQWVRETGGSIVAGIEAMAVGPTSWVCNPRAMSLLSWRALDMILISAAYFEIFNNFICDLAFGHEIFWNKEACHEQKRQAQWACMPTMSCCPIFTSHARSPWTQNLGGSSAGFRVGIGNTLCLQLSESLTAPKSSAFNLNQKYSACRKKTVALYETWLALVLYCTLYFSLTSLFEPSTYAENDGRERQRLISLVLFFPCGPYYR